LSPHKIKKKRINVHCSIQSSASKLLPTKLFQMHQCAMAFRPEMTFWPEMAFRPEMAIWQEIAFRPEMTRIELIRYIFGQNGF
jgi:hypothetical protein